MHTSFPMRTGQTLEEGENYYSTEMTENGRYRAFCYPLPQAGTYRIWPSFGPTAGTEGTITLISAPAILYANSRTVSYGYIHWDHNGGGKSLNAAWYGPGAFGISFTIPATTLTIARSATSSGNSLGSRSPIPNADLWKDGTYNLSLAPSASSTTTTLNLPAGSYGYSFGNNETVTLSIP
jgi:hypothetical protein